jgi:hypothetical protein
MIFHFLILNCLLILHSIISLLAFLYLYSAHLSTLILWFCCMNGLLTGVHNFFLIFSVSVLSTRFTFMTRLCLCFALFLSFLYFLK